ETALSVAPITLPTHASLLTGLYPYHHGARNNGTFTLSKDVETLAQRFRAAGYTTEAIVSAAVLDSRYGLDRGFQRYDDDLYGGHDKLFMFQEVRADVSVDKALRRLEAADGPLFLWLHLFDAHADYEPPPPYDVLFRDSPYDGEIAWLDAQLGRLADALDPETLLVVTADHGDSLGEHGENTHGIFVYRSATHVPCS
ncbi:MAG: sulfatase-like hydrolase/transferase, partial [Myxococcales bacterium]|nr:sulfatase-like hydrolase/transferase [Myxococcales bacterium]